MASFKCFEEIEAWQMSRTLCQRIYLIILETGLKTDFKLRNQIENSSGSVMDNIAEGFGRGGNREFAQFLEISHASVCEVQSQLYRVLDRMYITQMYFEELYALAQEIKKKLLALIRYLHNSAIKGPKYRFRS
jgi:four helix bundle protein